MEIDMTREEAIKELRGFIGQLTEGCQEVIKVLVPELRESEDERIRNRIIGYLKQDIEEYPERKERIEDMIAYLEKQKESLHIQKTCKENADSFTDIKNRNIRGCIGMALTDVSESRFKMYGVTLKECLAYLEKQKEQKPVERSLEDDHIIGFVYDLLNEIEWKDNWAMSKEECLERLKSLRPQPKQEWSEEDEKMLNRIINDYENGDEYWFKAQCSTPFRSKINWLKSLRPPKNWKEGWCEDCKVRYNRWKPSKEQMRVLSWAANGMVDKCIAAPEMRAVLRELYNDLKKLGVKEEPEHYQHFDQDC